MSLTEILKLVSPLASSSSSSPTGTNPFIAHLSTVNYKDIVKVANYSLLIEITPDSDPPVSPPNRYRMCHDRVL